LGNVSAFWGCGMVIEVSRDAIAAAKDLSFSSKQSAIS
jgi:hypothetical protein